MVRTLQEVTTDTSGYIEADNNDGYRYAAAAFKLPWAIEGGVEGDWIVSLLAPWRSTYLFGGAEDGVLYYTYVWEKLVPPDYSPWHIMRLNGITEIVARLLGREGILSANLWELGIDELPKPDHGL